MTQLDGIGILSAPTDKADLARGRAGIKFYENLEKKVPYLILGAGPDLNSVLGYSEPVENPDDHKALYDFLMEETNELIGLDINSKTSVENLLYGFPKPQEGKYGIVTEPWHYKKFKRIEKVLKRKGMISKNLEFFNIPSEDLTNYGLLRKILSFIKTEQELMKI